MIVCTIADDRHNRKNRLYGATQQKIYNFIKNSSLGISHFNMWGWEEIKNSKHYLQYREMLDITDPALNGRLYKPLLIRDSLDKINAGDYVIYNDVSPEMWNNLDKINLSTYNINTITNLCDFNDGILTLLGWFDHDGKDFIHFKKGTGGHHTHHNFTSEACIKAMDGEKYRHSLQHASGLVIIKKRADTIDFIDEWIKFNSTLECGALGKKENGTWFGDCKDPIKLGHRHDQSISGILVNKKNGKLCEPIQGEFINPHNFLNYCKENTEYTFIDSNMKREVKKYFKRIVEPPYGFTVEIM